MNRRFALAGLLRLKQMEQDLATGALAAAKAQRAKLAARREAGRLELGEGPDSADSAGALLAVAAARSASRGMLADLNALIGHSEPELRRAQEEFHRVRAQAVTLEKLADKHRAAVVADGLKSEQNALDEIASAVWHRSPNEARA